MTPLWFYLRRRGRPPRVYIRRDMQNCSITEQVLLRDAVSIIIPICSRNEYQKNLGDMPGIHAITPIEKGGYDTRVWVCCPRYKGLIFPLDRKEELFSGLTNILGPVGTKPDNLFVPNYE